MPDSAGSYEDYLQVLAPATKRQGRLFEDPWQAWYQKRDRNEIVQAVFPAFERAWHEFLKLSLAAWRRDVFEAVEHAEGRAAANQALPGLTLRALLTSAGELPAAEGLGAPHREKIVLMLSLAIRAGGLTFDWLAAGHIPVELEEEWLLPEGHRTVEEAFKLARHEGDLTEVIFGKVVNEHSEDESRHAFKAYTISEPGARRSWGYGSFIAIALRGPRKKPDLKLYTLTDLLYVGVLWHTMESTAPHVTEPQMAAQKGPPGVLLGQFKTGEILVHLNTLKSVLIEGRIRNLACQYPRGAEGGTVLSLRTADHQILATILGAGGHTIGAAKGLNGLATSRLDPHVIFLLSSLWSSRTFEGVLDARRLRAMLPAQPKKAAIRWTPAAGDVFEGTQPVAPDDVLPLFDLRTLNVTALSVEERLGLYWEISANQPQWSPEQVGDVKKALPADLKLTVEKTLTVANYGGGWQQVAKVHSDDGKPIAFASDLHFTVPSVEVKLDIARFPQGKLFLSWMEALSFQADQVNKRTEDRAETEFTRPRLLAKDALPQLSAKGARWGGKWQEKVVVRPESGWHDVEDRTCSSCGQRKPAPGMFGSGRDTVEQHSNTRSVGGGRVLLRPANLTVSQRMSPHVVFTMKVGTADIVVSRSSRSWDSSEASVTGRATFESETGQITLRGVPRGWATAARLVKLAQQWRDWAKKQLTLQGKIHRDLPQWLVLQGTDLERVEQHMDGRTSDAQTKLKEAKAALAKASKEAKAFGQKRAKWMRFRGRQARMPMTESEAAFLRHERLRRGLRI
jgi:hypothetical protein